jgi:hypothetical protein
MGPSIFWLEVSDSPTIMRGRLRNIVICVPQMDRKTVGCKSSRSLPRMASKNLRLLLRKKNDGSCELVDTCLQQMFGRELKKE